MCLLVDLNELTLRLMIEMTGKGCSVARETIEDQISCAKYSTRAHGKIGARSERRGTADEGQTRRQNASEWQRRGWSPAAEARHVGSEKIIHQCCDHTALFGLRLYAGKHRKCDFVLVA